VKDDLNVVGHGAKLRVNVINRRWQLSRNLIPKPRVFNQGLTRKKGIVLADYTVVVGYYDTAGCHYGAVNVYFGAVNLGFEGCNSFFFNVIFGFRLSRSFWSSPSEKALATPACGRQGLIQIIPQAEWVPQRH
jgi:hypothetical protein